MIRTRRASVHFYFLFLVHLLVIGGIIIYIESLHDTPVKPASPYTVTRNDEIAGLIVRADPGCPYKPGTGAILTGSLIPDGLAGDAQHARYHVVAGPTCTADVIIDLQSLQPLADRQAMEQDKIHQAVTSLPPSVMQDALSMANHR